MSPEEERTALVEALAAVEAVAKAVRGVQDKTKAVRLERALTRASESGAKTAVAAVAMEAGTEPFMLDEWSSGKPHELLVDVLDRAARRIKDSFITKVHPDMVPEILAGQPSGLVYLPPDLLRLLYALGEAVADVQDRKGGGERVESEGKKLMEQASVWVRESRKRWGLPDGWRLVQVRKDGEISLFPYEVPF